MTWDAIPILVALNRDEQDYRGKRGKVGISSEMFTSLLDTLRRK